MQGNEVTKTVSIIFLFSISLYWFLATLYLPFLLNATLILRNTLLKWVVVYWVLSKSHWLTADLHTIGESRNLWKISQVQSGLDRLDRRKGYNLLLQAQCHLNSIS